MFCLALAARRLGAARPARRALRARHARGRRLRAALARGRLPQRLRRGRLRAPLRRGVVRRALRRRARTGAHRREPPPLRGEVGHALAARTGAARPSDYDSVDADDPRRVVDREPAARATRRSSSATATTRCSSSTARDGAGTSRRPTTACYAGHYPADSADAIAQLERCASAEGRTSSYRAPASGGSTTTTASREHLESDRCVSRLSPRRSLRRLCARGCVDEASASCSTAVHGARPSVERCERIRTLIAAPVATSSRCASARSGARGACEARSRHPPARRVGRLATRASTRAMGNRATHERIARLRGTHRARARADARSRAGGAGSGDGQSGRRSPAPARGRVAGHFPQQADGRYAGFYPQDAGAGDRAAAAAQVAGHPVRRVPGHCVLVARVLFRSLASLARARARLDRATTAVFDLRASRQGIDRVKSDGRHERQRERRTRPTVLYICHNHPAFGPGAPRPTRSSCIAPCATRTAFEADLPRERRPAAVARSVAPTSAPTSGLVDESPDEYFFYTDGYDLRLDVRDDRTTRSSTPSICGRSCEAVEPDIVHLQHTMFFGYDVLREIRNTLRTRRSSTRSTSSCRSATGRARWCGRRPRSPASKPRRGAATSASRTSPRRRSSCASASSSRSSSSSTSSSRPAHSCATGTSTGDFPPSRIVVEEYGRTPRPVPAVDDARTGHPNRFGFFGQLTPFKGIHVAARGDAALLGTTAETDPLLTRARSRPRRGRSDPAIDGPARLDPRREPRPPARHVPEPRARNCSSETARERDVRRPRTTTRTSCSPDGATSTGSSCRRSGGRTRRS